jgi:hypothetical protein
MSLLKHITGAVGGAIKGFASGGFGGAIAGGIKGAVGPGNPQKTKNRGVQPGINTTKGKVQLSPIASPTAIAGSAPVLTAASTPTQSPSTTVTAGAMSASGLVRQSRFGGQMSLRPGGVQTAAFNGGGATGSWPADNPIFNVQAPPMYIQPQYDFTSTGQRLPSTFASSYSMYYTKKGTPRRTKANGQPYKRPSMNPMNPRAARRAIRRIRGARKLLQRIERSLPKARTHSRPVRRAA